MPGARPLSGQISDLMLLLDDLPEERNTAEFREKIFSYVKDLPPSARPPELIRRVARMYHQTEEDIYARIDPARKRSDFEPLLPRSGWLRDYVEFTRQTEPPTVYHFFAGAVVMASALARNVYFRRGDKDIYPNLCVILVGPSGRVRKTTACNLGIDLFKAVGGNVLADKLTPEALVEAFKDKSDATGLIYAPELAVFLGKQKYQEGMVPMLTALFDNPAVWRSATIMRGEAELHNVGITMLGASTLDWIQTAIPRDAFGGGFMSRLLFVVQESTPRSFPIPPPLDEKVKVDLIRRVRLMTQIRGEFSLSPEALAWFVKWYTNLDERAADNKHYAGYYARKPDHLWRVAMILAISGGAKTESLLLTSDHFKQALGILDWVEAFLPGTFDQLGESSVGSDQMAIVAQLKKAGGSEKHSMLLRKNARKMNAQSFRQFIDTLRAAGIVEYDQKERAYYLTPEGWKM